MKNLVRYLLEEKKLYSKVDIKSFPWSKSFTLPPQKKELPFSANGLAVAPGCLEFVAECDLVAEVAESVAPAVDPKNIGHTLYIWYTLTNTHINLIHI